METSHQIDVLALDAAHRQALEDVIGAPLEANQHLVINVTVLPSNGTEAVPDATAPDSARPPQSLADWAAVYDGLSEEQIGAIDRDLNTRANLTRGLA